MQQSIEDFVAAYSKKISKLKGYASFTKDLSRCRTHIDYCNVSSRLLSNHYGTHVDESLSIAYRRFILPLFRPEEASA